MVFLACTYRAVAPYGSSAGARRLKHMHVGSFSSVDMKTAVAPQLKHGGEQKMRCLLL